jgi:hypothetical protein
MADLKYTGAQVEDALSKAMTALQPNDGYVTENQLDDAIAQAITTTLNTEV